MENNKIPFSRNLRFLREEKNLPQDKFALEIGYSKSIISDWENGKKTPNAIALIKLSEYFKKSIDFLVGLEDEYGNKLYIEKNNLKTHSEYPKYFHTQKNSIFTHEDFKNFEKLFEKLKKQYTEGTEN